MFFFDENNILTCQMGTGDIMVSSVEFEKISLKECTGIVFGKCEQGEINRKLPEFADKKDSEAGVKFKLLFTDAKSIDVVMRALKQAKTNMVTAKKMEDKK